MSTENKHETTVTLANGVKIPILGFGCSFGHWAKNDPEQTMFLPEQAYAALPMALRAGYRHFDGAYFYGTHRILGQTLGAQFATNALTRKDVFVTTKVFHPPVDGIGNNAICKSLDMTNPDIDVKKRIMIDFETSLDELTLGYVDLLLMHWPGKFDSTDEKLNRRLRKECWEVFEAIYKSGRAKAIGVSNFQPRHLTTFLEDCRVKPMVNQIEISPYITQDATIKMCKEHNIVVEAWSPFGSGASGVLKDPVIIEMANKYNKNVGQVILRWLIQQQIVVLPRSSNEKRAASNMDVFDFNITEEDMQAISALNRNEGSAGSSDSIA